MPDLRVEELSFAYPGSSSSTLSKVDLKIPEGQFVLLAGPSGCGKSTLALALAGLIPSRVPGRLSGNVYLGPDNVSSMEVQEASQRIGMVFQNPDDQLIHLDVGSEVAFGPENLALPRREIGERVERSLRYTGMDGFAKSTTFSLSGGQKQRVAISATLAMQPDVLVLDEPTSDLDPVGTQEVLGVLRALNAERRMTIILIEHKIDEVIPWVDRVLLMDRGEISVDQPPRKAFDDAESWDRLGVSVPEMVRVGRALPEAFQGSTPLSVDEACDGLRGTFYAKLLSRNGAGSQTLDRWRPEPGDRNGSTKPGDLLSWEHVDLAYGKQPVLRDLGLGVGPGEWVALTGPNGSGKTTLASLVMGFQRPDGGTVRCFGKEVVAGRISQQARDVGYLFQAADGMLFSPTVEKEFLFGKHHGREDRGYPPLSLEELLELTDLREHRHHNPFQLSHGQRKRLALGALLAVGPRAIILDEPTTGQDDGHARTFLRFLEELRKQRGLTYMMITHDMRAAARYASRIVVLRGGRVHASAAPEIVFAQEETLAACGLVPPPTALLHGRLSDGKADSVILTPDEFLRVLRPEKAVL